MLEYSCKFYFSVEDAEIDYNSRISRAINKVRPAVIEEVLIENVSFNFMYGLFSNSKTTFKLTTADRRMMIGLLDNFIKAVSKNQENDNMPKRRKR